MVRTVSGHRVSHIESSIASVCSRQAAESKWRQQLSFDGIHDRLRALFTQHGVRQTRGQNLIRPHGSVWDAIKDTVVKTCGVLIPEQFIEASLRKIRYGRVLHCIFRIADLLSDI